MKTVSVTKSLKKLRGLKANFQQVIRENYEHRAQDCLTCPTRGACCTDAHFVNVHITELEAVAARDTLKKLGEEHEREVYRRVEETIEKYGLRSGGESFSKTFACPLFEKETGCLVHSEAKPAPCIQHACYENRADLPPDRLQTQIEEKIERLNRQTYRRNAVWLPLPVWLSRIGPPTADEDCSASGPA